MATVLRTLAGFILGIVVFAGLLYFLIVGNLSQRLVQSDTYTVAISETDAYARIYDEVLVDEALKSQTGNLLGDIEIEAHEEAVDVLREVLPPSYLRRQTEENVDRFTAFLRKEEDDLQIYVRLREPLEQIEPAVVNKIHQIIDDLEIDDPPSGGCSLASVNQLAAASAKPYAQLSNGQLPESAPSLKILTRECREQEFDRWFNLVLDDPAMNSQSALILDSRREVIYEDFVEGDTRKFLKSVAVPLVEPLIDDAISDIRRELQRNDRFDVLDWLSEESSDLTSFDIEEQSESLRNIVSTANGTGWWLSLVLAVAGSLLMAAVNLPNPSRMLRAPGITLALGGGVCLIVGFVVNSAVPGRVSDAIARAASYTADTPVSVINLTGDLVESLARQATAGFIPAAVLVIVLGVLLIAASLLWGVLSPVARRLIPGSSGDQRDR